MEAEGRWSWAGGRSPIRMGSAPGKNSGSQRAGASATVRMPGVLHYIVAWPPAPEVVIIVMAFFAAMMALRAPAMCPRESAAWVIGLLILMMFALWAVGKERRAVSIEHAEDRGTFRKILAHAEAMLGHMETIRQTTIALSVAHERVQAAADSSLLKRGALELSQEILQFLDGRIAKEPPMPPWPNATYVAVPAEGEIANPLTWALESPEFKEWQDYNKKTVALYTERFYGRVAAMRARLNAAGFFNAGLEGKLTPTHPLGILLIARALGALAETIPNNASES